MIQNKHNSAVQHIRKTARSLLPQRLFRLLAETYNLCAGSQRIGWKNYSRLRSLCPDRATADGTLVEFTLPRLLHPLYVRRGTPDAIEIIHTIIRENYGKYLPAEPVKLIIDAGAYIGDTTAWYLSRFPAARVIALEPDPQTFQNLMRNCQLYAPRAELHHAALWPKQVRLCFRDGARGTTDVSMLEAAEDAPFDCIGISPQHLLEASGAKQIDIFKCDIEGSEVDLFSSDVDDWVSSTRSMFIDVHNRRAREVVTAVARRHAFTCYEWRELLILRR
jgi:FkbM family methyltransferase